MIFDPSERERLDRVILMNRFSVDDFDFKLVKVDDIVLPDQRYVPKKRYKVTRIANGISRIYPTGAGAVWPDDVSADLKAGEFGQPST